MPDVINLVTEKNSRRIPSSSAVDRINLNHVVTHTEPAAREIHVVALVKHVD